MFGNFRRNQEPGSNVSFSSVRFASKSATITDISRTVWKE